jgi:hypothetical protein
VKDRGGDQRGGGGLIGTQIKFFARIGLCPKIKTLGNLSSRRWLKHFPTAKSDPNKITKLSEEEWDQSNLRLGNYAQSSHQMLLLKMSSRHVRPWTGYVRSGRIYLVKVPDMSGLPRIILLNFDYWAMRHQIGWNLDTRVTSWHGIPQIFKSNVLKSLDCLKIEDTCWGSS